MKRGLILSLCLCSGLAYADQNNSANNGFSNAAIAGQSNTQVNINSNSSAKYGGGVECPESTLTIAPYAAQSTMGTTTGQTEGLAVGVSIPLGDSGTCRNMAANLERNQRTQQKYEQIKLCIELKKNKIKIDDFVDPDLVATCKGVHL